MFWVGLVMEECGWTRWLPSATTAKQQPREIVLGTADMEHSGVLVGVEPAASVS